jgi:hypothetical protein
MYDLANESGNLSFNLCLRKRMEPKLSGEQQHQPHIAVARGKHLFQFRQWAWPTAAQFFRQRDFLLEVVDVDGAKKKSNLGSYAPRFFATANLLEERLDHHHTVAFPVIGRLEHALQSVCESFIQEHGCPVRSMQIRQS